MRIPHPHRKGVYALIAVPVLAAVPIVAAGGGRSEHDQPALAEVAPAPTSAAHGDGRPARAALVGAPRRHAGTVVLRASVHGARARIVAVTFLLDGRPLGTDTTKPYALDLDETEMPAGRHALAVEAVDRLGRRIRSSSVSVTGGRRGRPAVTATLRHGLRRALAALRRGASRSGSAPVATSSTACAWAPTRACSAPAPRRCWSPRRAALRPR